MSNITIYHKPTCSTSRKVLALILAAGHTPEVIDYMKCGWTLATLKRLLKALDLKPRNILRLRETQAVEMGLGDVNVTDAQILAAMVKVPVLVERPIVVSPKGSILARPPETVLAIL